MMYILENRILFKGIIIKKNMTNKRKQRAWGRNSRIVVEGFIPGDNSQSATNSKSDGERGTARREKKKGSQMAREAEVYLGLGKISEEYIRFEVGREEMVLGSGEDSWEYHVLVSGKILVSGESFDLGKEQDRDDLASLLRLEKGPTSENVQEMAVPSMNGNVYDMLTEFVDGHEDFEFNRRREVLSYKGKNYGCEVSGDSQLIVQIYKDQGSFNLSFPDFERDLIRFLSSRRKWEDY